MSVGGTVLAVTGATPTTLTPASGLGFSFAPGGVARYRAGDEIILIDKTAGASGLERAFSNVAKGISTLYDVTVYDDASTSTLRARIGGQEPNKQSEILSGPTLVGLTLVNLGAGWDLNVTDSLNLDFSAKYFWVRQEGKTVSVLDEQVKFDDTDSHRVKGGMRLTFMPHKRFDVFAGAYYEHELGGDIDADNRSSGNAISTLDMGGASGVFELGISILPFETRHMTLDMVFSGSTGTREGFGGHLSLGWNF